MARKIIIFDTTLRDGEQSPGASMIVEQKIEIAEALDRLGVDRIEAGFPVSSPVQFDAVKRISKAVKNATVAGLARCKRMDIDAVRDSLAKCPNKMIHVFIATSPLHVKYKLRMSEDEVIASITEHIAYARAQGFKEIEFSPEDASRSEWNFLLRALKTAVAAGANTLNIPDTVGYAMPDEYGELMAGIKKAIPELGEKVRLSAHCHNDLGVALANSLAAVKAGADQVEVTLNGIGERAGNAALEELVMSLRVREDIWNVETNVRTEFLYPTSRLLQTITGLLIPRNKPIFGENVFSHESGIHQHGVLKHRETYEIMDPANIGRNTQTLVMGRHSGKHALKEKLEQYNIVLHGRQMDTFYRKFIAIADKKKEVFDEDLFALVSSVLGEFPTGWRLELFQTWTGNRVIPSATVQIRKGDEIQLGTQAGDGPIDAVFKSIDECSGVNGRLMEFVIQAVGGGKDAQGEVKLQVDFGGIVVDGKASSTDIIEASALAYINALNRMEMIRDGEKTSKSSGENEQVVRETV